MIAIEGMSRADSEQIKIFLCLAAAVLAISWKHLPALPAKQFLRVLSLLALVNYGRFGTKVPFDRVDTYDLLHYYVNAKYFDELGYYDLYPAILLVDQENGGPHFEEQGDLYMAQDASGHTIRPVRHGTARGAEVKETQFDAESWDNFTHDVLYLQRDRAGLTKETWRQMIQDHGYNGTPTWTWMARPLTWVPVEYVKWIGWIDVGLLAGAIGLAGVAFGADTAWWVLLWFAVSYSLRWPTVSWAMLRYDYVAALLAATALVRLGRHRLAGALIGYAAMVRLFPVVWLWGPFSKGVSGLTQGVVSRPLLGLALGAVLAVGALEMGTLLMLGVEPQRVHLENMEDHNRADQLSSRRIGLALGLAYDGQVLPKIIDAGEKSQIESQRPLRYGLAAAFLVIVGWALRKARDEEALGFGFLPFFLLTTASYYYYVTRVTLTAIHAGDLDRWRNRIGLSALFGMELFCNWAETVYPEHRLFLIGWLAWLLAAYAVVMGVWLTWEARSGPRRPILRGQFSEAGDLPGSDVRV